MKLKDLIRAGAVSASLLLSLLPAPVLAESEPALPTEAEIREVLKDRVTIVCKTKGAPHELKEQNYTLPAGSYAMSGLMRDAETNIPVVELTVSADAYIDLFEKDTPETCHEFSEATMHFLLGYENGKWEEFENNVYEIQTKCLEDIPLEMQAVRLSPEDGPEGTYYQKGDSLLWEVTVHNPNLTAKTLKLNSAINGGQGEVEGIELKDGAVKIKPGQTITYQTRWTADGNPIDAKAVVTASSWFQSGLNGSEWTGEVDLPVEGMKTIDWSGFDLHAACGTAHAEAGEEVEYTLTLNNDSLVDLENVKVEHVLDPEVLEFVSADDGYDAKTGVWTVKKVADGSSATLNIKAKVKDGVKTGTVVKTETKLDKAEAGGRNRLGKSDKKTVNTEFTVRKANLAEMAKSSADQSPWLMWAVAGGAAVLLAILLVAMKKRKAQ